MKITLIRAEKESGKEALSTLEADALIKKLQKCSRGFVDSGQLE